MYRFLCLIVRAFISLIFRVKVVGADNIPGEGGFLLCGNHISNWDAPLIQVFIKRRIYYMAKDELFHAFGVGLILKLIKAIPVKRSGADFNSIKLAIKTVKNGDVLGIFPTGQREKVKGEGEVKSGVGFLAVKTDAPVIPVRIVASYRLFSRVTMYIGSPRTYSPSEGRPTAEDYENISKAIYNDIKMLGEE